MLPILLLVLLLLLPPDLRGLLLQLLLLLCLATSLAGPSKQLCCQVGRGLSLRHWGQWWPVINNHGSRDHVHCAQIACCWWRCLLACCWCCSLPHVLATMAATMAAIYLHQVCEVSSGMHSLMALHTWHRCTRDGATTSSIMHCPAPTIMCSPAVTMHFLKHSASAYLCHCCCVLQQLQGSAICATPQVHAMPAQLMLRWRAECLLGLAGGLVTGLDGTPPGQPPGLLCQ